MSLKIYLLGQFKLEANEHPVELPSRPAQSLLAYLVLNAGVKHRREKLAFLLWPDATETNARSYLRQALWRIRKSLTAASLSWEEYLQINDINLAFDSQSDYWLDADILLAAADRQVIENQIETINLYKGELLPGFYDEWVVLARDRLQAAYHQKMNLLLQQLVQTRRWGELLIWSEEWIRLGYAPEAAYRGLMMAHAGLGDQGMVNSTYRRCVDSLARDLNVGPSPETLQLYEQLQRGVFPQAGTHLPDLPAPGGQLPGFLAAEPHTQAVPLLVDQSSFVARDDELAQLEAYLDKALVGQGGVVFITGEIGSGKTALADEFIRRVQAAHPGLITARGNCNAHTGKGDPYLPFRELMGLLTGDVEARWAAGTIGQSHARLLWNTLPLTATALMEVGPDLIDTFIPGGALLERTKTFTSNPSAHSNSDWPNQLEAIVKRRENAAASSVMGQSDLFEQYSKVLNTIARQSPLVLFIDDLQWADLGSISLLFHLGRHLSGNRIFLFGAYRPEEITLGRDGQRHPLESVVNELQREFGDITVNLKQAQNREFIDAFLDQEPNCLDTTFRDMLFRQTQGHPLFTTELLRGMQERSDLVQNAAGEWQAGSSLDWETMPARVEAVVAERIGRLAQPLWEILRTASVEGQIFTAEVVTSICATPDREALRLLSLELDRKHLLIRTHSIQRLGDQLISAYQFRHILFQKYLYGSLDEVERVHLHQQVGNILEERYQTEAQRTSIAPQLARHFLEAQHIPKAVHYLLLAGENAVQLSAYQEAISHLTKGLALLLTLPVSTERDQQELKFQLALGMAWIGPKAYGAEVKSAYFRARQLCQQLGETRQLCKVLGQISVLHFVQSNHQAARELAEESLALAEQIEDPMLVVLGHWYLGFISFYAGDYCKAQGHLQHVTAYYRPEIHHQALVSLRGSDAGMSAMAYQACYLWCLGYPDQALKVSQEVLQLARESQHPFTLADVICYAGGWFNAIRREPQALLDCAQELMYISTEQSFGGWLETGTSLHGEALAMIGQTSEGIAQIRQGIAFNESLGLYCSSIGSLRALGAALAADGQPEEGLNTLDQAIVLTEQTGENHWKAEIYRLRGEILVALGDETGAEASFLDAVEVAQGQQAKSWELRAATSLADLWAKQGESDRAVQLLSEIYSWFTEGFDTPDLKAARVRLEKLA